MNRSMVPVSMFVKEMKEHWEELGHVSNKALEDTWRQLAEAFIDHVKAHEDPSKDGIWTVLSHPTGTGKTEGAILYGAMLSGVFTAAPQLHPGILIVTRMIKDANRIANDINKHSKRYAPGLIDTDSVTVAFHSEADDDLKRRDLRNFPVLVITHKAYENALDGLESRISPTMWDYFHDYLNRKRKLVIIDESIDLILEARMGSDDVRKLLGLIPGPLYDEFQEEVRWLERLQKHFKEIPANGGSEPVANSVLLDSSMLASVYESPEGDYYFPPMFRDLRESLFEYRSTVAPFPNSKDSGSEDNSRRGLDELIRGANAVLLNPWLWQTTYEGNPTLNTARLLVPEDVKGAVVLDATAVENVFYDVFSLAKRLPRIPGTRRYDNVTLHVSKEHVTGKITMRHAKDAPGQLAAELETIAKGRRTLVISHLEMEGKIRKAAKHLTPEKGYTLDFTHWGAISGSNDWRDFDTVVLFGLHHLPLTWAVNVFFACQGVQPDAWLSSTGNRPFGKHMDIKEALKVGQLTADVVQAINRIRCREVVDAEGNCNKADVYILLPRGNAGNAILSGIRNAMPGIGVVDWEYAGQKSKPRQLKYQEDLITFLREMEPGKIPVAVVRERYGIPENTFERIRKKIRERSLEEPVGKTMVEYGVRYVKEREGSISRAFFSKDTAIGDLLTPI
jgi:hypothetical protein